MAQERGIHGAFAQWITGRQSYFLEVPGAPRAQDLSIMSFVLDEQFGEPYRIELTLTSPDSLVRADYLNRPATFTIEPAGIGAGTVRTFAGCITAFGQVRKTRDFVSYRIVVEPFVARLRLTEASRIYQQQSVPEIVESILRRHEFRSHQFSFKLRRAYPRLAFRMQYRMSDWDYIRLLMEQAGLFCFFRAGQHGDELHFGDDVDAYTYRPDVVIPYREASGLETGHEAVLSLESLSETIPQSIKVADYNPEKAYDRFNAEANIARDDPTTWGLRYVFGTHHLDGDEARYEAQLRHEAAVAWQVVYSGKSSVVDFAPALVVKLDERPADAPHGIVIVSVRHAGGRDASYINTFKAIPCGRPFRLKFDERRWPTIAGTLSARVTTPDALPYDRASRCERAAVRLDRRTRTPVRRGGAAHAHRGSYARGDGLHIRSDGPLAEGDDAGPEGSVRVRSGGQSGGSGEDPAAPERGNARGADGAGAAGHRGGSRVVGSAPGRADDAGAARAAQAVVGRTGGADQLDAGAAEVRGERADGTESHALRVSRTREPGTEGGAGRGDVAVQIRRGAPARPGRSLCEAAGGG